MCSGPGPYGEWGSKKYLVSSLDQSLKRMGLDYVDIFYSHRPDPNTPLEETMAALDLIVRQGKALYVGISNYSAEQTEKAIGLLHSLGTPCLIHQPKYSMFERWVEHGLLDVVGRHGVGLIAFSPLAQGMLTNKYLPGIPEGSRASKAHGFLETGAPFRREAVEDPPAQRHRPGARAVAGANGDRLAAQRPARHLGAHRYQPGGTNRRLLPGGAAHRV